MSDRFYKKCDKNPISGSLAGSLIQPSKYSWRKAWNKKKFKTQED